MDRYGSDETTSSEITPRGTAFFCDLDKKQSAAIVRAVLRGERPLYDLTGAGISPSDPVANAEMFAGLSLRSADLAEGMMNLKDNALALSEWAGFVVRAAELFECAPQDAQCCERLMSYIWQIPYGSGLSSRAVTLAAMVRNWPRRAA